MFRKKVLKSQAPSKERIAYFRVNDEKPTWSSNEIVMASIDVGYRNLAMVVERRSLLTKTIRNEVYVVTNISGGSSNLPDIMKGVTKFFESYRHYLLGCHIISIEKQMPENYLALRISQHILTWFTLRMNENPNNPYIVEFDPSLKYRPLGCPVGLTKDHIKRTWAPEKARSLLYIRGDVQSLAYFDSVKKKDDLSDVVLMNESLCLHWDMMLTTFEQYDIAQIDPEMQLKFVDPGIPEEVQGLTFKDV